MFSESLPSLVTRIIGEYNQGLYYFPFMVNSDRCDGICNTLGDRSGRICVPTTIEDVNLNVFNVITRINE